MIKIENLSYGVPTKDLYEKVSFEIKEGEHCVVIGSNGGGKSTLVNMIYHTEDYLYEGKIKKENCSRIGYMKQQPVRKEEENLTVFEFLAEDFLMKEKKMTELCEKMAEDYSDTLFLEYENLLDEMEAIDANHYESNIKKQLKLIDMEGAEQLALCLVSGGEYKLLQLIKEMLLLPDLLILDEPDAFLDFGNLNGLRKLINSYKRTLLVVTHNRYLLEHCFNKILHMEDKDLQEFEGNFAEYNQMLLLHKLEKQEQSSLEQEEILRTEKMVDRMQKEASRADIASLGRALHAKQTHLERLKQRAIKPPFLEIKRPQIEFPQAELSKEQELEVLLRAENYSLSFEEVLLKDISFEVKEGEKIALVGPNGTGKTTLMRHIYEKDHPGIWKKEHDKIQILSQNHREVLEEEHSVQQELEQWGIEKRSESEEYVKKYGFSPLVLEQKISRLSGGEKNLLQLLKISLSQANLLLLDEPTSHLDLYAQIELEKSIKEFAGAVLMVTHDFYTIVNCADYVLLVEDKGLRKMRMRTFRKMIYDQYFSKEYLELEEKKAQLEQGIMNAIKKKEFILGRKLWEQLEEIREKMKKCEG